MVGQYSVNSWCQMHFDVTDCMVQSTSSVIQTHNPWVMEAGYITVSLRAFFLYFTSFMLRVPSLWTLSRPIEDGCNTLHHEAEAIEILCLFRRKRMQVPLANHFNRPMPSTELWTLKNNSFSFNFGYKVHSRPSPGGLKLSYCATVTYWTSGSVLGR